MFTHELSSPGRCVWSVAAHLKLDQTKDLEKIIVNLVNKEHKSEDYLKKNPHGRVPVLSDGNFSMYESMSIIRYICEKVPAAESIFP